MHNTDKLQQAHERLTQAVESIVSGPPGCDARYPFRGVAPARDSGGWQDGSGWATWE